MPANWLIIDGNNLLHYDPRLAGLARRDFDRARRELVQGLDQLAGRLARRVTIVFDGVGPAPASATMPRRWRSCFRPPT